MIGNKLDGRYELLELIGSGGMADVYRACDLISKKTVAVKVLKEQFLGNEEVVHRFKNESRAISLLDHPNIVKVLDVSVWDKTQFLVMELIEGQDLRAFIQKNGGKLSWKETVRITEEVLYALQHAHEHGIIHRDIKPANIMILKNGSVKVMDFGIARFSRSGMQTSTDRTMGSVHYISPEQVSGEETDAKSDLYSLGITMYEMLTGKLPFEGESSVSVAIKQISDNPRPPRELEPDIPEGLEDIILRVLKKKPDERYDSAEGMLQAIQVFKQNPSIMFAYQYLSSSPTKYIDTIKDVKETATKPTATGNKKKKKKSPGHYILPVLFGMAFSALVGSAILIYMIFHFSGNSMFEEREDVELPNFVGMSVQDVVKNKEYSSKFKFTVQEEYRNDYAENEIYDQSPKGNKIVKEGHEIVLRVSKGVQIVTVPDVTGYTKEEAISTLGALNLSVLVRYETGSEVPIGQVIQTEPACNTDLSSGQQVTVFVSAEKVDNTRIVPNLVGLTSLDEAKTLLGQSGLSIGTVTEAENEAPVGTIIGQSVAEGTSVYTGTVVNLTTSTGVVTKIWEITVKIIGENSGEIKNGQEIKYGEEKYVTEGGGKEQSFTFSVSTTTNDAIAYIDGKEYKVTGDTEITLTKQIATRPNGCTCPAGENHNSANSECKASGSGGYDFGGGSDDSGNSGSSSGGFNWGDFGRN